MAEHTISPPASPSLPPLLAALCSLLVAHRPACRQDRPFHRMRALTFAHLFAFARRSWLNSLLMRQPLSPARAQSPGGSPRASPG